MLVSIDTSTEKPLPLGKGGFTETTNSDSWGFASINFKEDIL